MGENRQDLEGLIDELASPKFDIYSHGVFGCFGREPGHYLKETRGPCDRMIYYADREWEYVSIFEYDNSGVEFKARVCEKKVHEGLTFRLMFNDRRGDHRGNSHTDYTILVPESRVPHVKPIIRSNPELLIEVFRRVFPNYDRSEGTLSMHDVKPYWVVNAKAA
jgi:hypothetical protein